MGECIRSEAASMLNRRSNCDACPGAQFLFRLLIPNVDLGKVGCKSERCLGKGGNREGKKPFMPAPRRMGFCRDQNPIVHSYVRSILLAKTGLQAFAKPCSNCC